VNLRFGCPENSTPRGFYFDIEVQILEHFLICAWPGFVARVFYFKENPAHIPASRKDQNRNSSSRFTLNPLASTDGRGSEERGACLLTTWGRSETSLGPGDLELAPACEQSTGARIYLRGRARRELAQPSLVTWCERATARESEGTFWVIQEPAPM
jgi:hypothetical protein